MLVALSPSTVIGTLMTMFFGLILASSCPSRIIPGASRAMTSAEIGPSTMAVISVITSRKSRPLLAISEGLVVTPSTSPSSQAARISAISAVSIKNFMMAAFQCWGEGSSYGSAVNFFQLGQISIATFPRTEIEHALLGMDGEGVVQGEMESTFGVMHQR